jgi:hypothetical protein
MSETATPAEPTMTSKFREATDPWSIPVFRFRRLQVTLSYLVFLVAAVVIGIALNDSLLGSADGLGAATAIAIGFWIAGWLIQGITYLVISRLIGAPVGRLPIGLLGVKALPRRWSASAALTVSLATISSPVILGVLFVVIEGGFQLPVVSTEPNSLWTVPSVGVSKHDAPWLAGAWLCWAQAILQLVPLDRSLGRQVLASLIALIVPKHGLDSKVHILRASLTGIALVTVAAAIRLYLIRSFPGWLIVLALGVAVWMTGKSKHLIEIFRGFEQYSEEVQQTGLRESARQLIRSRQSRRRIKQALEQERGEAIDAARLDDVLNQLHTGGADSLSKQDRKLLQRVSERVRKERDADSASG